MLAAVLWALALSSLSPAPATAQAGSYQRCDISNGQVFSCSGSWFQGSAVVFHDSAYRRCDISNGQVFSCGSWHQGEAVVFHDGAYRRCDISNGQVFSCGSWYQGEAVVYTNR